MALRRMVSLVRTAEEKAEERERMDNPVPVGQRVPDVPWGLQISLDGCTLDKLGIELDDDVKPGDVLHMNIMAEVTATTKRTATGSPDDERVELSITHILSFENETTEDADDEGEEGE